MSSFWHESIAFGSLKVPRVMAAPLDGVTDSPLRQLIRRFSTTELLYTEMRHIACVANSRVPTLFSYQACEQPLAYQISANNTRWIEEAVEAIVSHGFVMLNLNMGCPAPQVIRSGSGSALMNNIPLYKEIVTSIQKTIDGRIPFTIKIRAGFKHTNAVEIAQIAQDLGVEGLIIHPRLQNGGFTSPLDYDTTAAVKKAVSIPVIFSGNINNYQRMVKVHERTGVDGFMIGRALWGCPWKMHEIMEEAAGRKFVIPIVEMVRLARMHLDLNLALYGPRGVNPFKKQLPQYIRGVDGASQIRSHLVRLQTAEEMASALDNLIVSC
jgi:tRNA-dihydrouridine synthase B